MLGALPHRTLQSLSRKYGPIMSLQLGRVPTVVVSSAKTAELFLKTHDSVFASRPKLQAAEVMSYDFKGIVFTEYGTYWRNMKKTCSLQLLSTSKVELFSPLRKEVLDLAVMSLQKASILGQVVNLSEVVENLIEDIMYKMVLGHDKDDPQFDLKRLIQDATRMLGAFNIADYVPWLGAFDFQGLKRGFKKINNAVDEVLEKIIEEHEQAANEAKRHSKDFIDILLSMKNQPLLDSEDEQNHIIDRNNVKAIMSDMLAASIDTTTPVIEWALSELLRHPRVMKILQDELEDEVGLRRMVQETDLDKLIYLNMVVSETLRLYPVSPLIPRESREDITIDGNYIEKKSRIIINAWAIGRDPNVWSDNAEEFYPERFNNNKIDFRGQDFKFVPFGSGRRGCPGIQLGLTTVKLVLAQLVRCFKWELPCNNLDMEEKFGFTIPRAQPLQAIPTYRLSLTKFIILILIPI